MTLPHGFSPQCVGRRETCPICNPQLSNTKKPKVFTLPFHGGHIALGLWIFFNAMIIITAITYTPLVLIFLLFTMVLGGLLLSEIHDGYASNKISKVFGKLAYLKKIPFRVKLRDD